MIPIPDNLLINLKILSKIQKNGRIARSYDGIISLESDKYYQPIKRFLSSDSRKQAVFEINSIVSESIATINTILNSKYMSKNFHQTEEFAKNCENLQLLVHEMELAKNGILNLKFTYQNDQNIVSQLDITILKLNTTIKDVSNKLTHFLSFMHSNIYYHPPEMQHVSSQPSTSHHPPPTPPPPHTPQIKDLYEAELESIRIDQTPSKTSIIHMSDIHSDDYQS